MMRAMIMATVKVKPTARPIRSEMMMVGPAVKAAASGALMKRSKYRSGSSRTPGG